MNPLAEDVAMIHPRRFKSFQHDSDAGDRAPRWHAIILGMTFAVTCLIGRQSHAASASSLQVLISPTQLVAVTPNTPLQELSDETQRFNLDNDEDKSRFLKYFEPNRLAGGQDLGGGDEIEASFVQYGKHLSLALKKLARISPRSLRGFPVREFTDAVEKVDVVSTPLKLILGDREKAALNFPSLNLILVNEKRIADAYGRERKSLAFHEYTRFTSLPDSAYETSSMVLARLLGLQGRDYQLDISTTIELPRPMTQNEIIAQTTIPAQVDELPFDVGFIPGSGGRLDYLSYVVTDELMGAQRLYIFFDAITEGMHPARRKEIAKSLAKCRARLDKGAAIRKLEISQLYLTVISCE